jgi:plasmid stabilization system protein ParE
MNITLYLKTNPRIGRMVPEMGRQVKFREIIYGNYRIIYKITSTLTVSILTINHSSKCLKQTSLKRLN